ncbi:MAG TPA: hypothetical protein VES20_13645, partial [Bryobacteraceae bacterium]|nr:hypothetical protein [Bryobacteraceae bacterium]
ARVTPLDNFAVEGRALVYEDLSQKYGFSKGGTVASEWFAYEAPGALADKLPGGGLRVPAALHGAPDGSIVVARLRLEGRPAEQKVDVYIRRGQGRWDVVGVSRSW